MKKKVISVIKWNILLFTFFVLFFSTKSIAAASNQKYVTEVDSVQYTSYEDAWSAALSSGKEITMLSDWTIDDVINVDASKSVTLNMNGFMINRGRNSSTGSGQIFLVKKNSTLNINGGGTQEHRGNILGNGIWASNESGTHIITGSLITGGYNSNGGGAIHIQESATVNLNKVTVAGNATSDSSEAGAISLQGNNSILKLNCSSILYNASTSGGGAAIRLEGTGTHVEIYNSKISHNITGGSSSDGGAIQINNGRVVVTDNSEISYNTSMRNGGGVYVYDGDFITDNTVKFYYNTAKKDGGAVYVNENADEVVLSGEYIGNKSSEEGGAFYINQDITTQIKDATFYGNIARTHGGAIYVEDDDFISLEGKIYMTQNTPNGLYLNNMANVTNILLTGDSSIGLDVSFELSESNPMRVGVLNATCLYSEKPGYELEIINENYVYFKEKEINSLPDSYTVNKQTFELKSGTFMYSSISNVNLKAKYYYSDGYFCGSPLAYNEHLATMSLNLALSAMTSELNGREYTEEIAAEHVIRLLQDIGFENLYVHFPFPTFYGIDEPIISTIGYIIGSKTITINNEDVTLIAVAVRGGGYGAEWSSNVILGDGSGEAKGFCDAANQVEAGVLEYISNNNIDTSKTKFWLTGHSRAAATANLTSKRLTDKFGVENVYSYCFETPKGGVSSLLVEGCNYFNIHNVISLSDVVQMVGPSEMGFIRYGIDHVIPSTKVDTDEYNAQKQLMLSQLAVLNKDIAFNDYFKTATVDYFYSYLFGTNLVSETKWDYSTAEDFISFFIKELQERSLTDKSNDNEFNNTSKNWKGYRNYYSNYTWYLQDVDGNLKIISSGVAPSNYVGNEDKYITMTFEEGLVNLVGLFFTMDDVAKNSLMSNISMDKLKEELSMYDIWTEVIDEWEHMSLKNKNNWLIDIWNALKVDNISNDIISSQDKIKIKHSLYVVLDVLLDFVAEDYEHNDQNGVGTFVHNATRILQTHYHDVVAAWVRSYDSFYAVDYVAPPFEPTVNIESGIYNESLEIELSADVNEKIYYTLDGSMPVVGDENTFEYTSSIKLLLVDSELETYVINAISVEDGIKSEVATFYYHISDYNDFISDFMVSDITYKEQLSVNIESKFGEVIYLYASEEDGEFSLIEPTDPGIYFVKAIVEGNEYYDQIETEVKSFEIKKIEIDLAELKWNNDSFTYDASEKTVLLEGLELDSSIVEITYENNKYCDAGNYTAIANIVLHEPNFYVLINEPNLTHDWVIKTATNKFVVDVDIENWEYGQAPSIPQAEAKYGEVVFMYSTTIDGVYEENVPTLPGIYYVKGYVFGANNYNELISEPAQFEIYKNSNRFTTEFIINDWVYGENPNYAVASLYGEIVVLYSNVIDGEYSLVVPSETGTYYAKAIVEETELYKGLTSEVVEFSIIKANNEFINDVMIENWEYGQAHSIPQAEVKNGEVVFMYSNSIDGIYEKNVPTLPGIYYVKGYVNESDNYNQLISDPVMFEIYKMNNLFTTELIINDWVYGENPNYTVASLYGEVVVLYSLTIDGEYNTTIPTQAGTYYAKAIVEETNIYKGLISEAVELTINKADNEFIKEVSINSWIYGDAAAIPNAKAKYGYVIFMYSTSLDGEYSFYQPTNSGTYYLKVIVLEDANHKGLEKVVQFEIKKANPSVDIPSGLTAKKGTKLSSVELPANWCWNSDVVLDSTGKVEVKATYTPDDLNNYNVIEVVIEIKVKANHNAAIVISSSVVTLSTCLSLAVTVMKKKGLLFFKKK